MLSYFISLYAASFIFSLLGLLTEVFFSAGLSLLEHGWKKAKGDVHMAMAPVYFLSYFFLSATIDYVGWNNILWMQIYIVTCIVYLVEYLFGIIYDRLNIQAWHYDHVIFGIRLDVNNKITLAYFPFWLVFSFLVLKYHELWIRLVGPRFSLS